MNTEDEVRIEETLDPQDWSEVRALGHRMLDDMIDYLESVRERPVWKPIPEPIKDSFKQPLPLEPQPVDEVYKEFQENVLYHPMGNIHPRFWGWVIGTGTVTGMLAEMLAAGMNPNLGGGDQVPAYVEAQVLDWCKQVMGYPQSASGLLVSGGSMANLIGLAVARYARAGFDIRQEGLQSDHPLLTFYGSEEMHSSVEKSIELMGVGLNALRLIPVNQEFQVDLQAMQAAIDSDRAAGFQPVCVIGNAGTVNTGAIDDLESLANICQREGLWFHVDGAFGALATLSPELRPLVAGMRRADSLAFDLHKWMYIPYEIGCVLVRDEETHRHAFSLTPDYLAHSTRGLAGGKLWFSDYGIELSRGFKALKAWMSIKEYGIKKYGRLIQQNVDQARYLARMVDEDSRLERLAPVSLNIVCFRYKGPHPKDVDLNALNQEILIRLHEQGIAAPSYTSVNGNYCLRVAITNHRSRFEDFEILVKEVLRLGEEILSEKEHL